MATAEEHYTIALAALADDSVTDADLRVAQVHIDLARLALDIAARPRATSATPPVARPNHLEQRADVLHVLRDKQVLTGDCSRPELADVIVADLERVPVTDTRRQVAVVDAALGRHTELWESDAVEVAEAIVMRLAKSRDGEVHAADQPAAPAEPRTWSLPAEPHGVTAVRDADGDVWFRDGDHWIYDAVVARNWSQVVALHGPLTEVTEDGAS